MTTYAQVWNHSIRDTSSRMWQALQWHLRLIVCSSVQPVINHWTVLISGTARRYNSRALVDGFRWRQRSKYVVPQGRCYSKALVLNSEVMVKMVFLEIFCWIERGVGVMQVVVCAIIDHVAQQATSKHARSGSCSSEELDKIPERIAQDGCGSWWKYKSKPIHWVLVMASMQKIMSRVCPVTFSIYVEQVPMQHVFNQCPDKYSCHNHQSYFWNCVAHLDRCIQAPANNRQPNERNCPPFRTC